MLFWLLLLPPVLAAILAFVVRPYRPWVGRAGVILALVALGAAVQLAAQVLAGGPAPTWGMRLGPLDLSDVLRADSLSALLMVCVTAVAALALLFGPGLRADGGEYTPRSAAPLPHLLQPVYGSDAAGRLGQQCRHDVDRRRSDDHLLGLHHPAQAQQGVGRGLLEIHPARLGGRCPGLCRHRAGLL